VATSVIIRKIKEAFTVLKKCSDASYNHNYSKVLEGLETDSDQLQIKELKWHLRTRYASFCSQTNLMGLQKKKEKEIS